MSSSSTAGDAEALRSAAERAASYVAEWQTAEGLWPNLIEGGPWLDVLHALGTRFLLHRQSPNARDGGVWVRRLLASRNKDGGIALWQGGPSDFTAGIEAYLALRLAGVPAADEALQQLGRWIAEHGGLDRCPASTWVKLVWSGAVPDARMESIPPEHFYFLDYDRFPPLVRQQTVCDAALAIAAYLRGAAQPAPASSAPRMRAELPPPRETEKTGFDLYSLSGLLITRWARFAPRALRDPIVFRAYDAMVAEALRWPTLPVALHAALAVDAAGGRGSAALSLLDRTLSMLGPPDGGSPPRPCEFGIRDAALAAQALAAAGRGANLQRSASALLARYRSRTAAPAGELASGWPLGDLFVAPDAETTALVLLALRRAAPHIDAGRPPIHEAAAALAAAQQKDGGWNTGPGTVSAADVTATVLQALIECGCPASSPATVRAVNFLEQSQHAEGWWEGARGVNRLHGTALSLRGLRAAGVDEREAVILRAGEWLRSIQNADGSWGEAVSAVRTSEFPAGPGTPAQTAWALLGLLAGGDTSSESVRRGFAWLLEHQRNSGGWAPAGPCLPGVAGAPFLIDPLGAVLYPLLALRERLALLSVP